MLTGSRKRLYKVLPIILKAAIPVRAARKIGLPLPAAIVISCILVAGKVELSPVRGACYEPRIAILF
jgi:hypothetical protein